jgi:predicted lipid-binding transport protein (Tim44 family)
VIDIYTIIFLTLAVIIFLILRRVLGQRTGREQLPARWATNDNLESTDTVPASAQPVDRAESKEGIAEPGSSVARGLDAIARKDKSFTANHFLGGAQTAYEMIVLAYAQGDRRVLRKLLSREVYEGFEAVIREQEAKGETVESRFVAIEKSDITAVELRKRMAQITVRFVSQLISVTRDKDGNVIDGDPEKATNITDVWTFARDMSSRDPNWKLVATEAGHEKEQGPA